MKFQATVLAVALISLFPLASNAQNSLNINLNDVMVGQRMQDMSQRLNDANSSSTFTEKRHHQKHDKKIKGQKAALLQKTDEQSSNNETNVSVPIAKSDSI